MKQIAEEKKTAMRIVVCVCCSEFKVFGLGFNPQESLVVWNSISCSESDSDTGFGSRAMQNAHGNVMKKRYIST